jgi:hypothetical protein
VATITVTHLRLGRISSCLTLTSQFAGRDSLVVGERLGLELATLLAIRKHMGDANCGRDTLDSALHQFHVWIVTQAEVVQTRSFGPADVTRGGIALGVNVRVVVDEGLPVLITGAFD